MEDFIQEFKAEASGIIGQLQEQLLLLEQDRKNKQLVIEIFRGIHTLKGSSRMFGFESIEKITHDLENTFDQIRNDARVVSGSVIDLSLEVIDLCSEILGGKTDESKFQAVLHKLGAKDFVREDLETSKHTIYHILYHPARNSYERGVNPIAALEELKSSGEHMVINLNKSAPPLDVQAANKAFESIFGILLVYNGKRTDLDDIFIFLDDTEYSIHEVSADASGWPAIINRAENLAGVKFSPAEIKEQENFLTSVSTTVELVKGETETSDTDATEQARQNNVLSESSAIHYLNVKLDRLDDMMKLVSELVTIKAELQYQVARLNDITLLNTVERLEKVSTRFRDNAFSMRLVPIQVLSLKFQRMVRDLGANLGKEIRLITEGLDTEIDKTIINEIEAPLMHIIRNAIDHGLESPEERLAIGKDKSGLLKIVAFYAGASVFIQVQDDGRGLNLKRIREKAISKGIIDAATTLTDNEIINLIFESGFSTTDHATEYSGRGVGMDVVKHKLKQLRGSIEITTEPNLGTAFTIRLPLSLSILDVLHVKVNDVNYLLPHNEVEACFSERINSDIIQKRSYNLKYKEKLIPHLQLSKLLNIESAEQANEPCIIVINKNDERISLEVDTIVGEEQLVIKPVDEALKSVEFMSGMAVLGNGELAFLIDSLKLRESFAIDHRESQRCA